MLSKTHHRYPGISNEKAQSHKLFHLVRADFPGINFTSAPGKLRLDQNDGTDVPLAQIPDVLTGKDADTLDGKHASNVLLRDGTQSLQGDLGVDAGKKIDGVDVSENVDNVINEAQAVVYSTSSINYVELTRWRFRKGQHKTAYLAFEAMDTNENGSVRITLTDGTNSVIHEQTDIRSSWAEYTASKDLSTLSDGWCHIILEGKSNTPPTLSVRRFALAIKRT